MNAASTQEKFKFHKVYRCCKWHQHLKNLLCIAKEIIQVKFYRGFTPELLIIHNWKNKWRWDWDVLGDSVTYMYGSCFVGGNHLAYSFISLVYWSLNLVYRYIIEIVCPLPVDYCKMTCRHDNLSGFADGNINMPS